MITIIKVSKVNLKDNVPDVSDITKTLNKPYTIIKRCMKQGDFFLNKRKT